jgi:hypothetical protein
MTVYTSSSRLHSREVMLIRRLLVLGWSDHRIWKEYRIPIPVIQKAKKDIEIQATEKFENKEIQAVELSKWKDRLKEIVDNMDSIAKDLSVSYAHRLNAERMTSLKLTLSGWQRILLRKL